MPKLTLKYQFQSQGNNPLFVNQGEDQDQTTLPGLTAVDNYLNFVGPRLSLTRPGDHYELMYTGWDEHRRVYGSVLHIDIKDNKVWIQHDGIEGGVAEELVEAGIPREVIVLGFQPPELRPYTEYATA